MKFRNLCLWFLGILHEVRDDCRSNAATSSSSPAGDLSSHDQEEAAMPMGGVVMSSSRVITGTSEILDLLKTLGEGYRLSCMYRCQVLQSHCLRNDVLILLVSLCCF